MVPENSSGSWSTMLTVLAQRVEREVADVVAVDQDPATAGS